MRLLGLPEAENAQMFPVRRQRRFPCGRPQGGRAVPISADWRNDADYEYCDNLTPEQVAFEFLRRNPDYDADYRKGSDESPTASTSEPAPAAARWGLRFRHRPSPA